MTKARRDDPDKKRKVTLTAGSEHEIGRELLLTLRLEGGKHEVVSTDSSLWEYIEKRGLWVPVPEDELHRIVGSFDGNEYWEGKNERVLRISDSFARGAVRRAEVLASSPNFFVEAAPVLVFTDKAVRVTETGGVQVHSHAAEHRATVGYPFKYNPNAKAARFRKMLQEHFAGDEDADAKIACLQEFFGACLLGIATRFQKCLALPSDGGGGRSTMMEVIEKAMPEGFVGHVEARDLRKAERRAKLPGKRLNFSDEVPPDAFLESEDFKKIIVGNTVTGEEKYRPSFDFRPVAGHVFPIQIAASAEMSDAFWRRFIIVRYNRNFEGDKRRDFMLAGKIIEQELAGVVSWMIEGAARLLKNGRYTIPASHVTEEAKWKLATDTVRAFLDTMYTKAVFKDPRSQGYDVDGRPNGEAIKAHDWTPSGVLYRAYRTWCDDNGHRKPVAVQEFKRRVEKIGYQLYHTNKGNFYGVRPLDKAQETLNRRAEGSGKPPGIIRGAVTLLHGVPHLKVVKNDKMANGSEELR